MPIKDIKAELCFDLPGGNTNNGTQLQLYWCNGSDAQDFYYDTSNKQIKHRPTGKCADLNNNDRSNGTKIQLWDCGGDNDAQKWDRQVSNNGGKLWGFNLANNNQKCIDTGSRDAGALLKIWDCPGTDQRAPHQKFWPSMEGERTPPARDEDARSVGFGNRNDVADRWCARHNYGGKGNYNDDGSYYFSFNCIDTKSLTDSDKQKCCEENILKQRGYIVSDGVEKKCSEGDMSPTIPFCRNHMGNICKNGDNIINNPKCQKLKEKNNDLYSEALENYCNRNFGNARTPICWNHCNGNNKCNIFNMLNKCHTLRLSDKDCNANNVSSLEKDCQRYAIYNEAWGNIGDTQCSRESLKLLKNNCNKYNIKDAQCTTALVIQKQAEEVATKSSKEAEKEANERDEKNRIEREEQSRLLRESIEKASMDADYSTTQGLIGTTTGINDMLNEYYIYIIIVVVFMFLLSSLSASVLLI